MAFPHWLTLLLIALKLLGLLTWPWVAVIAPLIAWRAWLLMRPSFMEGFRRDFARKTAEREVKGQIERTLRKLDRRGPRPVPGPEDAA